MKKTILWIVVIVIIALGGYYFMNMRNTDTVGTDIVPDINQATEIPTAGIQVMYTDTGFEPGALTIKAGQKIEFMNHTSSKDLHVGFGEHLDHSEYPDQIAHPLIKPGGGDIVTFPTAGSFEYHNHFEEGHTGTVAVE